MKMAAHGVSGGIMSDLQGGSFDSGFLSGAVSSLVSSGVIAIGEAKNSLSFYGRTGWSQNTTAAVTIAAGSLSGGLSSVIAGGNFWAGARQGFITSGLNHTAHSFYIKAVNKGILLDALKGGGYEDPMNTKADFSDSTIDNLIDDVSLIGDYYEFAGKPGYRTMGNPAGKSNINAEAFATYDDKMTKLENKPYIRVYKSAFTSIYQVASTFMHELFHVYNHNSGLYLANYNIFRNDPYRVDIMENLMEFGATNFQVYLGDSGAIYNRDLYLQKFNRLVK